MGLLSSLHRHGFQSSQLRHGPCLSVPLWRSPSCVPVRVCPEGPPECPPPLPDGTVKARDEPFGRGEVMSVLCRVCHVFPRLLCPYLVCFLSLFMSLWVLFQLCFISLYVNYPVFISPVLLSLISSGLLVTPRCILSVSLALSCPVNIKDYYLSLSPRLRVPVSSSCVHRDRCNIKPKCT